MGSRGRKSIASLLTVEADGRPDAPYNISDLAAQEWRAIVNTMPVGFFARSHYPLLAQLCRHVVASNRLEMLIEQLCRKKTFDAAQLASFHAQQAIESASIVRLSRQLRLGPQQLYRGESAKIRPAPSQKVPWHRD